MTVWEKSDWQQGAQETRVLVLCLYQNGEIAMLGEITHLQAIIDDLTVLTTDPHKLPPASEQVKPTHTTQDTHEENNKRPANLWTSLCLSLSGDQRSERVRLQLVLSDPALISKQLWLPQEQHVQVLTHTHTHTHTHTQAQTHRQSQHNCLINRKRSCVWCLCDCLCVCVCVCVCLSVCVNPSSLSVQPV